MGCCQSSTVSSNDQVTLELSKEFSHKQEHHSETPQINIPEIHLLKFDTQKSPTLFPSNSSYYSLGAKLSSAPCLNRFICTYSQSTSQKEVMIIRKSSFKPRDLQKLIENSSKLSQFHTENIVQILYVGEDSSFVKIITEPCGERTIEDLISNNKIPFGPALAFIKQIMQGVMQYHKLGVILKHLTEKDVFIVNNAVKISISATLAKDTQIDSPDLETDLKSDVWSLGVIFLKLLLAPTEFVSVEDALIKIESLKLHQDDTKIIQSMIKPLPQRPGLPEILNFNWQSNQMKQSLDSKTKKNYIIEKISEELSEGLSQDEADNKSERIENNSVSSNEFYQSEELEMGEYEEEFNNEEWQEVDMNVNNKVRVCEILNDEMKEIIESIPDHEVSSFDNVSNDGLRSLPETPLISQTQESPSNLLIIPEFEAKNEEMQEFDSKIPLSNSFHYVKQVDLLPDPVKMHSERIRPVSEMQSVKLKGTLKFFSTRKRTGLIACQETHQDYILSQDELLISGVNLQKFTKQVLLGSEVKLQFSSLGNKAVDISLLPYQ